MATQLEECAGVSLNEICDSCSAILQKKVQRIFPKDIPTTNLIRMWYEKFVEKGCIHKEETSGQPPMSGETKYRTQQAYL